MTPREGSHAVSRHFPRDRVIPWGFRAVHHQFLRLQAPILRWSYGGTCNTRKATPFASVSMSEMGLTQKKGPPKMVACSSWFPFETKQRG